LLVRSARTLAAARCRAGAHCLVSLAVPVMRHPSKPSPRQKLCAASPRPIPSRRCQRCQLAVSACRHAGPGRSHAPTRPQGLVPLPSPLLQPGVSTWSPLVAPLGLFPSRRLARSDPRVDRNPEAKLVMRQGGSALRRTARHVDESTEVRSLQRPARVLQNRPKWIPVKPGWGRVQEVCRSSLPFASPGWGRVQAACRS
jgi:hypothetical protein